MNKIKNIVAVAVLLCAFGVLKAQEGVNVGLKVMPSLVFSSITEDSTKTEPQGLDRTSTIGFGYGLMLNIGFSENIALNTGLTIMNRRAKYDINTTTPLGDFGLNNEHKFGTVILPVVLKMRTPEIGSDLHAFGLFGYENEINYSSELTTTITSPLIPSSTSTTKDNKFRNIYSGSFTVGGGVDYALDFGTATAGISYHGGLLNTANQDEVGYNQRFNYVSFDLGFFFGSAE